MSIKPQIPDFYVTGTFDSTSDSESHNLRISNNIAILTGICIFLSLDTFLFFSNPYYYRNVIIFTALYLPVSAIVFYLNKKGSLFLSGMVLNLVFTLIVFVFSGIFFGKTPGFHYYMLMLALIPLLTFKPNRFYFTVLLMLINIFGFIYVQYFKPADEFLFALPKSSISHFRDLSIFLIFSMMISIIWVSQRVLKIEESRLKKQAEIITKKNVELANLNISKDRFFSIIAHDLRGPVGTISTFLDYLADTSNHLTSEQFTESLDVLKRSSQDIYNLLENLLTWSRIQYGNIVFNRQKNELNELIRSNITLFKPMIKQKNISVINRTEKEDCCISIDKDMINTVLRNVLNNALKFTNNGGEIVVSIKKKENFVAVNIADNGIGMKRETIDNLFKIEVKQNNILGTYGEKGTGLGLILCKQFIERHGGKISIKSEPGIGSEFTFTIPVYND